MRFDFPWAFLLLLVIPVLIARRYRAGRGTLRFSSTTNAARAGSSLRQHFMGMPFFLRSIAIALLVTALARPQQGRERVRDISKGIAIEMVVDRSGSMRAEMEYGGERLNRLEVVKRVFEQFVIGDGRDLKGRPNDLIGMIAFARYADTMCPLTLAHGALSQFLAGINMVTQRSEDGTAIGDAIALAAARLKTAEETLARQADDKADRYEVKSKVIILLTDGENNAGKRSPKQAAKLAAKWGITIYAIGVAGEGVTTVQTLFGAYKVPTRPTIDTGALDAVAEITGGIARTATDEKSLRAIYKEIDKLERSEIESVRYMDYRELFVPFALGGLIVLALEALFACTLFRKIP